jgi:DNA helicase HerA-like ATPase
VSTQRPQKIPENVLSQADNLVLMRLNSIADAAFAEAAFSFVPPSLIERSVTFRQGEALLAGKISPRPALLRFDARITEEGGADVPATWAWPVDQDPGRRASAVRRSAAPDASPGSGSSKVSVS